MSRVFTEAQKKEIFKQLPAAVTIDTTEINASKIWSNQELTSYPTISLNVSNDGIQHIRDVYDGVLYYQSTLTIHILTKEASGINGAIIADAFSQAIITEIESWTTPLTGDVRIFNAEEDIHSVQPSYADHIFDYIISIDLYHA
ncbi:hypothetical protein [Methanococcoides sp. AM1]|uniref:hypothetical protein n=1 Tax=Methanococcoides sp. AM1 TaxID=1201011 RepID=UPI0010842749|nr:hypothetical protein [Methanococcoides sp. AM1]